MSAGEFLEVYRRQQQSRSGRAGGTAQTEAVVDSILEAAAPVGRPAASAGVKLCKLHRVIKLGVDVHLDRYVVVRQIDGDTPQPPQRFSPAAFLKWAQKQTELP